MAETSNQREKIAKSVSRDPHQAAVPGTQWCAWRQWSVGFIRRWSFDSGRWFVCGRFGPFAHIREYRLTQHL